MSYDCVPDPYGEQEGDQPGGAVSWNANKMLLGRRISRRYQQKESESSPVWLPPHETERLLALSISQVKGSARNCSRELVSSIGR